MKNFAPDNLAERAKGMGASDGGTAIGVNPYRSEYDLYLEKTGQVIIMVRSCTGDNNPYPFKTVKRKINKKLRQYRGKYKIIRVPNITNICYGRDVGYEIEKILLDKKIESISATEIRKKNEI